MTPVSTLIVGAGLMGRWHAHASRRAGGAPVGVVDPDVERASELSGRFPGAEAYASIDEALRECDPAVAHVCTPLDSHARLITRLLEAGLHVLAEKPLTPSGAETAQLLRLAEREGLRLCPVHQFLFQRGFMRCRAEAASAGAILHLDYVAASAGAAGRSPDEAEAIAADILPHPLSLARRLLGPSFSSAEWVAPRGTRGELRVSGACENTSIGILVSMGGRPTQNTLRVTCEDATFYLDLFHGFVLRDRAPVDRASKVLRPFRLGVRSTAAAAQNLAGRAIRREAAYPGLRELVRRFYGSIAGTDPDPISFSETEDVAEARDRILTARRDRR